MRQVSELPVLMHSNTAAAGRTLVTDEEQAVLVVAAWYEWAASLRRIKTLVFACSFFHLGVATVLTFAPYDQIYSPTTRPALELADRYVWASLFAVASMLVGALLWDRWNAKLKVPAWLLAFPVGGGWFTSILIGTVDGSASMLAAFVWGFLYALFAVTAVLHSLDRG